MWAAGERERLRLMYNGFSKRLGKRLLELGQLDLAAAVVRKLITATKRTKKPTPSF